MGEPLGQSRSFLHSESQVNTGQTAHPLMPAGQGKGWLTPGKLLLPASTPTELWRGGDPLIALQKALKTSGQCPCQWVVMGEPYHSNPTVDK